MSVFVNPRNDVAVQRCFRCRVAGLAAEGPRGSAFGSSFDGPSLDIH